MNTILSAANFRTRVASMVIASAIFLGMFAAIQPAHAQSTQPVEDMKSLIETLLEQIAELRQQIVARNAGGYNSVGIDADVVNRNLTIGSRGEDVRQLQKFLNVSIDTRVAEFGDGSQGRETTYFGPATAQALKKFQEKYRSDILTPNGLSAGSGFFGASSRAKMKALLNESRTNNYGVEMDSQEPIDVVCFSNNNPYSEGIKKTTIIDFRGIATTVSDGHFVCRSGEWKIEGSLPGDVKDPDPVDETTCMSNGKEYLEGTKTQTITIDGRTTSIDDAYYVCRSGEWKIEGSLPGDVKDHDPVDETTCMSNGKEYLEGTKTQTITVNGRTTSIDDAYYVCRSGEWKIEGSLPDDGTTCMSGNKVYTEGMRTQSITDSSGRTTYIDDAYYVCRSGEWKIEGSFAGDQDSDAR